MERLQEAIEKARAQRDGAPAPRRRTGRGAGAAVPAAVTEAWGALPEIELDPALLRRNRVAAFEGGHDAAPYDMLRTRMLQQTQANNWHRVALVSPDSGCGKSTTAANLAFSMGRQRDLRTLVLDLDLRRNGLGRILGQRVKGSMADVLEGRTEFADHALRHGDNVAFGFSRGTVPNPSEILQSQQARERLEALEAVFRPDIVIFDLPPLMAADDNYGFLQNVDCAMLLAGAEATGMDRIDVAERQIAELTNVMGMVLNKCRYTDGAYGYEYGYY